MIFSDLNMFMPNRTGFFHPLHLTENFSYRTGWYYRKRENPRVSGWEFSVSGNQQMATSEPVRILQQIFCLQRSARLLNY